MFGDITRTTIFLASNANERRLLAVSTLADFVFIRALLLFIVVHGENAVSNVSIVVDTNLGPVKRSLLDRSKIYFKRIIRTSRSVTHEIVMDLQFKFINQSYFCVMKRVLVTLEVFYIYHEDRASSLLNNLSMCYILYSRNWIGEM